MANARGSAVVIGASMGGLLAARALSGHFDRVTIVERDPLPDGAAPRKGVPQAAHAHGLLASGYRVLDGFFPRLMDELEARGVPRGDATGDCLWFLHGRWKLRFASGLRGITVSRPCLEAAIRGRVRALGNVAILDGMAVVTPVHDAATGRVRGVAIRPADRGSGQTRIDADLVVDATGRGSQSPRWLEEWGYGRPLVSTVKVDVGYATRVFERRPGELLDSFGTIVSGIPATTRYGAVLAVEESRWIVTLSGMLGDYPPDDEAGWTQFAASLPSPIIHQLVTSARPLSGIAIYRFPANQRRLYERMKRHPGGYLVTGDAMCSFNPIYGQGMSAAALEASVLDALLAHGVEQLPQRFYARVRKIVDIAWAIATGEDLQFPQVEGVRPFGFRRMNRYLDRVQAVASVDPLVCRRFFDVLNLLAPPSALLSPRIVWPVLTRRVPEGAGAPAGAGAWLPGA